MYARKQLDIDYGDLLAGCIACFRPWKAARLHQELAAQWNDADDTLPALSVRTAFDAWLTTLNLPHGSEVVASGINIPDMARILEHHGLKIVPVDLDLETLELQTDTLDAVITSRTRLILVAHLFGARLSMEPVFAAIRKHPKIQVAEDCAQAFTGLDDYRGDTRSDLCLFSFGAIKTATALGGALARIKNPAQRTAVQTQLETYRRDGRFYFFQRTLKYTLLKTLGLRPCYAAFVKFSQWLGLDYDAVIINTIRGFKEADLIPQLHRQPALPQLALLQRRLATYTRSRLDDRCRMGSSLNQAVSARWRSAGYRNPHHTWWLFPVAAPDPQGLVQVMRSAGFDATATSTQLTALHGETGPAQDCARFMRRTVYLPLHPNMSAVTLERMAALLRAQELQPEQLKALELAPAPIGK